MAKSYKYTDKRAHIPSKEEAGYENANQTVQEGNTESEYDKNPKNLSGKPETDWLKETEYKLKNRHWMNKSSDIASLLLDYLDDHPELTKHDLAKKTGLTTATISKLLKGGFDLKLSTIGKIEKALGIELVRVVGFEGYDKWVRELDEGFLGKRTKNQFRRIKNE